MTRPLWFVHLLKKTFPNVKLIAKLTRLPILRKIIDKLLFTGDEIFYLPLDNVIEVNQSVQDLEEIVLPSQILEYFINKASYHWIMNFCICRESMQCKNYPINLGCLFLGRAVLEINPNLGRLVSKEEALEHLRKCKEAGLVHMIGRNKLDKEWLGVRDGCQLLSICNCCPCCCLWRISPILHPEIGKKIKRMPGIRFYVDENCVACGTCTNGICFVDAIKIRGNIAEIDDECRGCGRCMDVCAQKAIKMEISDDFSIKEIFNELEKLVNLK